MRTEWFSEKGAKGTKQVCDEHSTLQITGTEQVNVYQLDDQGKKIKLLAKGTDLNVRVKDVEEILIESKGDYNAALEGPDPMDTTPIEVPVERPLTQTQQLKMWLQNENNMQALARSELTWDEFKDLGVLDDADEFYERFGNPNMTKYEMQAEALRQHQNPNRGMDLNQEAENVAQHSNMDSSESTQSDTNTATNGPNGPSDNSSQQMAQEAAGQTGESGEAG